MQKLFTLSVILTLSSCNTELATPFGCHMQSPVNIRTSATQGGVDHEVVIHYGTSKERIINTGHTVQLDYDSGSYVTFDGKDFQFRQFHFHTPSEHTVDDQPFNLEMHMVHTLDKPDGKENPEFLVIAVFFREGEANPFLSSFLDAVPEKANSSRTVENVRVDATEMLPDELNQYFHYKGSLTTPPYTETVDWIVIRDEKQASTAQIEKIHALEGDNARMVQALYGRQVEAVN